MVICVDRLAFLLPKSIASIIYWGKGLYGEKQISEKTKKTNTIIKQNEHYHYELN